MIGIYVHIPFCESKCVYCAFASFVKDESFQSDYFEFLNKEIRTCKFEDRQVSSIYFGGGTPSCVKPEKIVEVLTTIKNNFKVSENAEITIECNPCSTSLEKLKTYYLAGFNRVSFGVQSLDDDMLKFLSRRHTKTQALDAIKNAKAVGFENISADLLLGLPAGDIISDAEKLISAGAKHISAYMLQVEDGTPLKDMVKRGEANLPSDDQTVDNYQKLVDFLQKNRFLQYEISNFALNGFKSKHNYAYWTGQAYMGFGLGAHSFDGKNRRFANANNFNDYFVGKQSVEKLSPLQRDEEMIMLGLRCENGFNAQKLHFDIFQNANFKKHIERGVLQQFGNTIKLNPKFYSISNAVIIDLLP